MFLLLFIQVQIVLVVLRRKMADMPRGFRVPLVPVIPAIGIVLQLFLAAYLVFYSPMAWLSAVAWIVLGLFVYYGYARKRDKAYEHVVRMRTAAQSKHYRILACLDDPHDAVPVLGTAGLLAGGRDVELIALSVIEMPERELLARGLDNVAPVRRRLERAIERSAPPGVALRSLVKISHRVSYGIAETVLEEHCNVVIIHRERHAGLFQRMAASIIDRVVRETPTHTLVVSGERWPASLRQVTFAYDPGPHSQLAAEVAGQIAQNAGATVRAVHLYSPDESAEERERIAAELRQLADRVLPDAEVILQPALDVATGLLRLSRGSDLLVVGGTEAGMAEQLLGFAVPLEVAERAPVPVITVYQMPADPKRWMT